MSQEQIWAPWRLDYIKANTESVENDTDETLVLFPDGDADCFICCAAAQSGKEADRRNLVIARGEQTLTILNRFPYNNGHLLIAPKRHIGNLSQLTPEELLECQTTLAGFVEELEEKMQAEGFNIGLNLGRVAGAGLPGHLHWHLVPRWNGDTNFMPSLAGVKVIPQSLESLWEFLYR